MSDPFVGEIMLFAGNFAPAQWAFCNGQAMSSDQNETLYTVIGTTYGGTGPESFNLPDLQSRVAVNMGQGPGEYYPLGSTGGADSVALAVPQMPAHSHAPGANVGGPGQKLDPTDNVWSNDPLNTVSTYFTGNVATPRAMASGLIGEAGGNQPHENRQPYLAVSFCIALFGVFPSTT